jgi:hypothetical protein
MMRSSKAVLLMATIGLLIPVTQAYAQRGRGGGPRGGGFGGGLPPSSYNQGRPTGSMSPYGGTGTSRGETESSTGRYGGQYESGTRSGSYTTQRGGTINYGAAGEGGTGPGGTSAGRGVYGVSGTTAGGRSYSDVGRAGGASGPEGNTAGYRSNVGAVSGPRGTAVGGSQRAGAYGPGGSVQEGDRAGAAYGPGGVYGADAGRYGYGAVRPYGTYYANNAALAAQGAALAAGAGAYPAYNPAMYSGYPSAWAPTNMTNPSLYANPGYGAVAGQVGMPQQPATYDYGGNVVAQPNAVYVNGDNVGTPQQYAAQASQIAAAGGAEPDANSQWQPLGVFAMAEGDQAKQAAVLQLAVNSKGVLRGNFHNTSNDSMAPIAGAIDPKTQRAAWTVGGQKVPVFEASIANLTKDQTTMLMHTSDGRMKQFVLARLKDPASADQPPGDAQPQRP